METRPRPVHALAVRRGKLAGWRSIRRAPLSAGERLMLDLVLWSYPVRSQGVTTVIAAEESLIADCAVAAKTRSGRRSSLAIKRRQSVRRAEGKHDLPRRD